jgi:hypothetical protein
MSHLLLPLSEEFVAILQGPVNIVVASCDASLQGSVDLALGCRVWPDRRRISVMLRASQAAALLADVSASGRIAVNFARPSTNRSSQLKGSDARIEVARPLDFACVEKHVEDFVQELLPLREMPEPVLRAILHFERDDLAVISFTPEEAFIQTPGPDAGERF